MHLCVVSSGSRCQRLVLPLFFFNDTATTEIYTLSLHDALPIYKFQCGVRRREAGDFDVLQTAGTSGPDHFDFPDGLDRKSTRLNSSHLVISYAVFCLKKKKKKPRTSALP